MDLIIDLPITSLLPVLLLLFFPLLCFLLLRHASPRRRLPPSPPSLPLIGHLHHLLSSPSPPHHVFARLAAGLNTDILLLRLGRVPTLVVSSPSLACEVLKTQDHALASRPALLSAQYLSFGCSDVTFSPLGSYWRQARRICVSELLSPRRVASFGAIRRQEVDRLLRSLVAAGPSQAVDMSERFFQLANDVLCRVAFGRRFEKREEDGGRRKKTKGLVEVLEETQRLFAGFDAGEFFPGLVGEVVNAATGLRGRLERNLADLRAVCDEIIREHEEAAGGGGGAGEEREDFVDVLLKVQKGGGLEVPITDDNLKALVLDMFVAGTDTTSATLEWVMTELARHPRVLHKAQAEVRAAAAAAAAAAGRRDKGKSTVDEDDLPRLRYVKAVVKEALRVHPPVPLLVPRESVEACSVGGYAVPAKTRVLVNTYAIGKDPRVWEEPLEFRPERFVDARDDGGDDDVKKGRPPQQDFRLLPFGGGRRGCPGYTFALATVELALAKLLFHFDWRLLEGVQPEDVDLDEVFGLATRKKTPLVLVATMNPEHATLPNTAGPSSHSE